MIQCTCKFDMFDPLLESHEAKNTQQNKSLLSQLHFKCNLFVRLRIRAWFVWLKDFKKCQSCHMKAKNYFMFSSAVPVVLKTQTCESLGCVFIFKYIFWGFRRLWNTTKTISKLCSIWLYAKQQASPRSANTDSNFTTWTVELYWWLGQWWGDSSFLI